jgi:signal transduction histidine kinase
MLAGTGLFVYERFRQDLNDEVNLRLQGRAAAVMARLGTPLAGARGADLADPKEGFVQLIAPSGRLLDASGGARAQALTRSEVARVAGGDTLTLERQVAGIDGRARVLARRAQGRSGPLVLAVGQSLIDRDEALAGLERSFVLGGAAAIVLAAAVGYLLASAGLAPVEAMRRRAREVSLRRAGERLRLPLPRAHDEIRRLGETLNEMLERRQVSFERERRFVADASHALRTPIAVVKTELEGALQTTDYGPAVGEPLAAALDECDRLAQLAEDLLVLARAADGALSIRREAVAVDALLAATRDRFAARAQQHGRRISVECDSEPTLSADLLRLRQALANLLDNALRHGRGNIVLRAERTPSGTALEVSDQGPGFAPEIASRAFERFARGGDGREGGDAGLGLAIVEAIAEAHGGTAAIAAGRGSTVRLLLPREPPPPTSD